MNEAAFLSALHESPGDEVTWLALSDWLDDDGQAERAELVRIVRRLRALPATRRTKQRAAMEARVAALLSAGVRPVVPEVTNGVGMRLALVPPGCFRMGSPRNEPERMANEAPREVEITRAYYLGVFTVTQAQYQAVTGSNPSVTKGGREVADYPAENMSWEEAVAFCHKLTAMEATRSGLTYRLPTEAEWEYACRGGGISSTPFHVGASLDSTQANFNGAHPYGGAARGPFLSRPCKVGSYPPNALGLYDMHGNVWEWCADWLGDYDRAATRDPVGPGEGTYRVIRGGSWRGNASYCRAARRGGGRIDFRYDYLGFRVAAAPPLEPPAETS